MLFENPFTVAQKMILDKLFILRKPIYRHSCLSGSVMSENWSSDS